MTTRSVAHQPTAPTTSTIVGHIEHELARLKAARPHLTSRIERAEAILVTQLSVSNGTRPVKVRVHADGSRSYRVASGSKLGKVYTVHRGGFECDCPDSRRRHSACKHGISCYILERAYRRSPAPQTGLEHVGDVAVRVLEETASRYAAKSGTCSGCSEGTPYPELTEVADYHESLTYFVGDSLCLECFAASDCF